MNIFDRLILGLYAFCISIVSAVFILIGLKVIDYLWLSFYFDIILNSTQYMTSLAIIASIFLLVSIRFLLSGQKKSKDIQAITKKSELGDIRISILSIQNIVMSSIKEIDGVMEQKITVVNHKDTVKIKLKVIVSPDKNIQDLSIRVQNIAKDTVEKIAGVTVKSVEVHVDNVAKPIKQKTKVNNQVDTEQ